MAAAGIEPRTFSILGYALTTALFRLIEQGPWNQLRFALLLYLSFVRSVGLGQVQCDNQHETRLCHAIIPTSTNDDNQIAAQCQVNTQRSYPSCRTKHCSVDWKEKWHTQCKRWGSMHKSDGIGYFKKVDFYTACL